LAEKKGSVPMKSGRPQVRSLSRPPISELN